MTKFTNLICKSKTYIALGIAFGIVSCDNEFDLSDINTDMNVGGSIAVPIGSTETLTLSRIIDETDELTVDADGNYSLSTNGEMNVDVSKVDIIHIKDLSASPKEIELDFGASSIGGVIPSLDVNLPITTTLVMDAIQDIPTEVEEIDLLDILPINTSIIVKLKPKNPSVISKFSGAKLTDFSLIFPKEVIFAEGISELNYNTNVFKTSYAREFDANGQIVLNLPVEGLHNLPNIINHKMAVYEELPCDGRFIATINNVTVEEIDGMTMSVEFVIPDFDVERVKGIINTNVDISEELMEMGDLPDLVTDEDTELNVNTVAFKLSLLNPTGVPFDANLHLQAQNANHQPINLPVDVMVNIKAKQAFGESMTTNLYLTNSESLAAPEGYEKVLVPNLNQLIKKVPEYISVIPDVVINKSQSHYLELGKEFNSKVIYDVKLPFDFGANSHIVYRESIDDLNSDMQDIADYVKNIRIGADIFSTIPFNLNIKIVPIDIFGNDMSERLDFTKEVAIDASTDGSTPQKKTISLKEKTQGALKDLERLDLIIEGNTSAASTVLNSNQYIQVKMSAYLPEGVTITE